MPNTASLTAAYNLPVDELYHYARSSIEALGLTILPDSSSNSLILARSADSHFPATVRVHLNDLGGPNSRLEVHSSYVVKPGTFTDYPMELIFQMNRDLGRTAWDFSHVIPQVQYPAALGCGDVRPAGFGVEDSAKTVVINPMPQPVDGMKSTFRRAKYTKAARTAGIEGRVWIQFIVDEVGGVSCAEVLAGLPMGLSERSLSAILDQRFKPGQHNGENAKIKMVLPFTYLLRPYLLRRAETCSITGTCTWPLSLPIEGS